MKPHHWILIILGVTLLPLGFNWLTQQQSGLEVVGIDSDWLSYFGSLTSTATAFIVLWVTYNQNRRENKENRELQIKAIEYQQHMEHLNILRPAIIDYSEAHNVNDMLKLLTIMENDAIEARDGLHLKMLYDRIGRTQMAFHLLSQIPLPNIAIQKKLTFEQETLRQLNMITNVYISVIDDLQYINTSNITIGMSFNFATIEADMAKSGRKISPELKTYIRQTLNNPDKNTKDEYFKILRHYVANHTSHSSQTMDLLHKYLIYKEEQNKIV